ncbi:Fibroblast growth factor receptor 2 like protein [Verticillium longisporum]|uniref:Fibroblast growth factor receptor 2 like protein n=1 Tax=Verticillium longisporum TaxID=100787 RepID=A0A8I2ZJ94_VERLO|nr:Fibroblast growth factor receptor 2 like protein [Verticillium longisporum]
MGVMYHYTGDETQDGSRIVPALVLEYAAYGNLKEFQISGHASTFPDQIKVALDAASGIQALHRVGMIHGDVKPSNFLVCKHESRDFVVKLADFGFSLSVDDGRFVGHTQMYCAPESYDGKFERQYLKQLDMYSFGLTFLAILESGGTFYDNLPTQDLDMNVRKMKSADLMCTTMPMRVLKGSRHEGRPLAIVCKILKTCLQKSPAARFQDMDRIILLLRLAQHVSLGENSHASFNDTTAAQAAEIIKVIGGDNRPDATQAPPVLQQGYPQCLEYIQLAIDGLPKQQPAQLMQVEVKTLRDQAARLAQMTLWMHGFMVNTQERPLGDMLRQIMEKRVIADLFEAVGTPENGSDVIDFDTCKALGSQYEAEEKLVLSRYLDFIPNNLQLAASYATIEKMPWIVQTEATRSLQEILAHSSDARIKSSAAFNLAVAYTQGTGVEWDLETAKQYLFQAAGFGSEEAQTLYINIFASNGTNSTLPEPTVWRPQVLFWAITEDRPDAVALVIKEIPACTGTQTEPKGDFPLLAACRLGRTTIAKSLLDAQKGAGLADNFGVTPLHWLFRFPAAEMFDIAFGLCEKGADLHAVAASLLPTQYDTQVNESTELPSWTPLHWAIWSNNLAAVETLLTLGANPIFSKESNAGEARSSHGAPTDAVLELGEFKVPAVFAVAEHQCFAEVMIAGLENGFAREIDVFPQKDKRHNALLMAINHRDHAMVRALLTAGASTTVEDAHGLGPLERAAKESDNVFFVRSILETGISADPPDVSRISAFEMAVYTGNFNVARFLFDAGAAKDRVNTSGRTLLGEMILLHTRNALERIKFLLSLPDREGQDGFIVQHSTSRPISAFRFAVLQCKEADPTSQYADITDVMVAHLIEKYDSKNYFDSTDGEGHMSALTAAVGLGNHRVVKRLLEKGADPKIVDDKGRTAMSLVQHRYTYPESVGLLTERKVADLDSGTAERLCRRINQNTSELVGVLVSYGAFGDEMSTPEWYQGEKGYKCTHCVMEALRSKVGDSND